MSNCIQANNNIFHFLGIGKQTIKFYDTNNNAKSIQYFSDAKCTKPLGTGSEHNMSWGDTIYLRGNGTLKIGQRKSNTKSKFSTCTIDFDADVKSTTEPAKGKGDIYLSGDSTNKGFALSRCTTGTV